MGFLDQLKEGRDRRSQDRASSAYKSHVEAWLRACQRASELCLVARRPGVRSSDAPVQLWEGERLLMWWTGAELIAPKNTIVRNWTSASYRIGKKTTVRAGTSTTYSTIDRPTPIDRGTMAVTDRRVLFLGRTRSIDWQFRRLLGVTHDDSGTWTALHVSNRQRLHGVGYPRSHGDDVRFYVALAVALYRGEEDRFSSTLEADTLELLASPPAPPSGVAVDERVRRLAGTGHLDDTASAVKEIAQPAPRLAAAFAETDMRVVNTAAKLMGFRTAVVQDATTSPSDLDASMKAAAEAEGKSWAAVLVGDAELVATYLDGVPSATVRFVCATEAVLDELRLDPIDVEHLAASESGYAETSPEELSASFEADGYRSSPVTFGPESGENDVAVLDAVARVSRWIRERPQAMVLQGPTPALRRALGATRAYDFVAYCAPVDALKDLGVHIVDEAVVVEEDDVADVGTSPPIVIAGLTIANPAAAISRYLVEHADTVVNYDFIAGTRDEVDEELVRATRRPWMNSRISVDEATWFVEHGKSAPWDLVPRDARLADADARGAGGLYDAASTLWDHFSSKAPKRVGVAKVSKVLYLMRPHLYPILDSRLTAFYEEPAKAAAREVAATRPEFASFKRLQWEAIRRDIQSNLDALAELRVALHGSSVPLALEASERLSDVRLLDMLAWAAAGEPPDENDS